MHLHSLSLFRVVVRGNTSFGMLDNAGRLQLLGMSWQGDPILPLQALNLWHQLWPCCLAHLDWVNLQSVLRSCIGLCCCHLASEDALGACCFSLQALSGLGQPTNPAATAAAATALLAQQQRAAAAAAAMMSQDAARRDAATAYSLAQAAAYHAGAGLPMSYHALAAAAASSRATGGTSQNAEVPLAPQSGGSSNPLRTGFTG